MVFFMVIPVIIYIILAVRGEIADLRVTVTKYLQVIQVIPMTIIWYQMMRFKRIEVQVTEDENETTFSMIKKLEYIDRFVEVLITATILI